MTVIYNMSIDRADKPWIGDRRLTEAGTCWPGGTAGVTSAGRGGGGAAGLEA